MPNTGQYSRSCYSCRQRRCKCDLARPSCGQCLRAGISCVGYRDEVNMRFRIVNNSSFQQSPRYHRRKMRYNDPQIAIPSAQILYEPSQVWNLHVIPLVLDKFSIELVDTIIDSSIFGTIPRIISTSQEGSPVYAVCDAIACAYLATTTGTTAAMANRTRAYGTALRTVNAALDDPVQCRNDSTLLAVWMFVVYELIDPPFLSNPHLTSIAGSEEGNRHCRGMATLIHLRGSEQFSREDGRNLVWFVCHCTQAKALVAGRESPMEVLSWIHELCQHVQPSDYTIVQACTFAYHCTHLLGHIRKVLTGDSYLALATSLSTFQQMDEIEKIWSSSYDSPQPSIWSIGLHAYRGNFQMHLSASVLTLLTRACQSGCSQQQHTQFASMQERCIATFRATATNILRMQGMPQSIGHSPSSKFSLGWADAVMVYGSLRTITISPISLSWQRNEANRICAIIKQRLGFQFLL